ncbi:ubiquitin-protein ligase molybdopterin-converting factor [Jimgerdemannia flammicorona]|uniref:Ubiquitin-protein ligase molybdopterin-converting factor n=1 Tax=Jimgerdemannia flammicorona TaxID=994334 RepID=A0A433DMS2_9FUNG|nr:ubiquitin-protein ligase molybdopterin-converting factor [Jimgerdemannia flammicorona]
MSSSSLPDRLSQLLAQNSPSLKLGLTAVAASALTAFAIFGYQASNRRSRAKALKEELLHTPLTSSFLTEYGTIAKNSLSAPTSSTQNLATDFDENLIREQLARNLAFLGEDGLARVRRSFIIVVGAGGVGSWAALMLLRSGVEHLRIIDFDQVTLSSLNRHAVATHADVGTPKVTAMRKHLKDIAPHARIEAKIELFKKESAADLLSGKPDFVIDAIDNIDTKLDLIKYCHDHGLRVVSSMGAGAKADPSRIQIADISDTFEDPLARAVRRRLRRMGVDSGVPVAYSTEKPHHVKLLPLEDDKVPDADEYAPLQDFRVRILPVLGTIPSIFGMVLATHIILTLAGFPYDPLPIKLRDALYQRVHRDLHGREKSLYGNTKIPLDKRDVGYIMDEMWHGHSAISGATEKLTLTRWDRALPLSHSNAVCMTKAEAQAHEEGEGTDLPSTQRYPNGEFGFG